MIVIDIPQLTLVAWLIIGIIAGFLASVLTGARENLLTMIVLGILGAIIGGWIAKDVLHIAAVTGINATSIIVATIGALILIFLVGGVGRRRYY